jgi:hypothetical protein
MRLWTIIARWISMGQMIALNTLVLSLAFARELSCDVAVIGGGVGGCDSCAFLGVPLLWRVLNWTKLS